MCGGDGTSCDNSVLLSLAVTDGGVDVYMSNTAPVVGFQFSVSGIDLTGASGGSAGDAGFAVTTGPNGAIGFSMTGDSIPVGDGLLTSLTGDFTAEESCINDLILSVDAEGFLTQSGGECVATGWTEPVEQSTLDIYYSSDSDIYGFQFSAGGADLVSADGGAAADAGFMVSVGSNGVVGFSMGGAFVPAGDGILTTLTYVGDVAPCVSDLLLAGDAVGTALDVSVQDCNMIESYYVPGCSGGDLLQLNAVNESFAPLQNNNVILGCLSGCSAGAVTEDDFAWCIVNGCGWGDTFSDGCVDCYGEMGSCLVSNCTNECAGGWFDDCSACMEEQGCLGEFTDCSGVTYGCTDSSACDFDESANVGTSFLECTYPEENFDCNNECIVDLDCEGNCGGDLVVDECGVCGGDGPSGCDEQCGSVLEFDVCGVCGGDGTTCEQYSIDISFNSDADIYGFQFSAGGADLVSADGGAAADAGFMVSVGSNGVVGFSMGGAFVPAGDGILTTLTYVGDVAPCVSDLLLAGDAVGTALDADVEDCLYISYSAPVPTCDDLSACNAGEEGDCVYPEENYDCDNNCVVDTDCNGDCGGSAVEDSCGVCGGDGTSCENSVLLSLAVTDGGVDVYMSNTAPVVGFQFSVSGIDLTGASGGSAGDAGFAVTTGPNGAIGFSMTGDSIPAGDGLLTSLTGDFTAEESCINDLILSVDAEGFLTQSGGECVATGWTEPVPTCDDESACNYGAEGDCTYVADGECDCDGNVDLGCGCGEDNSCLESTVDVYYNSDADIYGFQFSAGGADLVSADGGAAADAGFMVSVGSNGVVGFSMGGAFVPAGDGVLTTLTYVGDVAPCVSDLLLAGDAVGTALDADVEDCLYISYSAPVPTCDDLSACNAGEEGDCVYPEENYDCDNNCVVDTDCNGDCGGSAVEDSCGVCGGDGTSCENSVLLSLAVTDGGVDVYMFNTAPVVGFQFSVSGIDLTGASGGSAADAGFGVTTGPNGAIGFSMTGDSIPAGDGLLTSLTGDFTAEESCINDLILSVDAEGFLTQSGGECVATGWTEPVPTCDDESACNYGAEGDCTYVADGECDCDGNVDLGCGCGEDNSCLESTVDVYYSSDADIYGFQFSAGGADLVSADGGAAADAGFMVSVGSNGVVGFSMGGAFVPAGDGILTTLTYVGDVAPCVSDLLLAGDAVGTALDADVEDCLYISYSAPVPTCDDLSACNAGEEGDCVYPEENYDCDNNCVVDTDCNGDCGGSAVEDSCGVCGGDGTSCENSVLLSLAVTDGGVDVYMSNTAPVVGFQFSVSGIDLTGASGGSAGDAGFAVTTGPNGAIGFSMTGDSIPAGDGLLTSLTGDFTAEESCINDLILSVDAEGFLTQSGGECVATGWTEPVPTCDDESACNYGAEGDCTYVADGECDCDGNVDLGCGCGEDNSCLESTVDVYYSSDADIYGFQFSAGGADLVSADGGAAAEAGFMVSVGSNGVVGFSMGGAFVPAGDGVLTTLTYVGDVAPCVSDLLLAGDAVGTALDADVEDCLYISYSAPVPTCDDLSACNAGEEGDCVYPEENYDCDNNCVVDTDCNGDCGGSAVEDSCVCVWW